jgi:hypothetical protein
LPGYCEPSDLYDFGLPRGAVPNPGRLLHSVDVALDWIALDVHGFALDDPVLFRAEAGGALPGGLAEGVSYFAIPIDESHFQVSATAGGAPIDLTSSGSTVLVISPLPVAAAIEWGARTIDDMLPAHVVPLASPYPPIVVATNAELAAGKLATRGGYVSKALSDIIAGAQKKLERWAKNVEIRGENAPQPAQGAAVATAVAVPADDVRGWFRWGSL